MSAKDSASRPIHFPKHYMYFPFSMKCFSFFVQIIMESRGWFCSTYFGAFGQNPRENKLLAVTKNKILPNSSGSWTAQTPSGVTNEQTQEADEGAKSSKTSSINM